MSEAAIRKVLRKKNIILKKDRTKEWTWSHQGGYMVISFTEGGNRFILAGETFDLSLDDVLAEFVSA